MCLSLRRIEEQPSPTMQHPDYFYGRQTSPRGARTESGPSRTSRTSRRTPSLQDATGMMTPIDGASGEVAEAAAGSLSKRTKQVRTSFLWDSGLSASCLGEEPNSLHRSENTKTNRNESLGRND
jgi:hypothetical protein